MSAEVAQVRSSLPFGARSAVRPYHRSDPIVASRLIGRHSTEPHDRDVDEARVYLLIAESTVPVTLDAKGCRVVSGRWQDPYTGARVHRSSTSGHRSPHPVGRGAPRRRPRLDAGTKAAIRQRSSPTPTRSSPFPPLPIGRKATETPPTGSRRTEHIAAAVGRQHRKCRL